MESPVTPHAFEFTDAGAANPTPRGIGSQLRSDWYLVLLLILCLGRMWIMPLPSSFWLDEAATVMLAQHPDDASFNVAPQLSATIYNAVPRTVHRLIGDTEIDYRIPSLLLAGLALWFVARIAARLIAPEAAWFAVFGCLCIADFNFYAGDVRPYAMGIFVATAGMWLLLRWMDSGTWRDAALFWLLAALLWRVHLAFWAFYPVFLLCGLLRMAGRDRRATWPQALAVVSATIVSLIPVALQALALFRSADTHVVARVVGLHYFSTSLAWEEVAGVGASAVVAGLIWRKQRDRTPALASVAIVGLWWLGMPVLLLAVSRLTGTGMFLIRYVSPALPGAALAATALAAFFVPARLWKPAAALLAVGALAVAGHWEALWPNHARYEDWRTMAGIADLAATSPDTPVVVPSGFAEGIRPNWTPDYQVPGFLYSQFYVYPVRGRIIPFPFSTAPEDEVYMKHLAADTLGRGDRFILFGGGENAHKWVNFLLQLPELAGWRMNYRLSGGLLVAVFDRNGVPGLSDPEAP